MSEQPTLRFKVLLLGEGTVGKTTFKNRFLTGKFTTGYTMTMGADFASHKMIFDNKPVIMSIWDMAGQKNQAILRKSFYPGAHGALILFDVTNIRTYNTIEKGWINELGVTLKNKIPILIIANKIDLRQERIIDTEKGLKLVDLIKNKGWEVDYFETSALEGTNVNESFTNLIKLILEDQSYSYKRTPSDNGKIFS